MPSENLQPISEYFVSYFERFVLGWNSYFIGRHMGEQGFLTFRRKLENLRL